MSTSSGDVARATSRVDDAVTAGNLSASAATHIKSWLTEPRYREYSPEVCAHVERGDWRTLDDVFWTIIPFGTGGRRGRMYPIGCNAINDRTIGESIQGLADYVKSHTAQPYGCAIAYDTRHRSHHFAKLAAEIMAAAGFTVYFLEPHRSTPELSFATRHFQCSCGIMVTASHNPPSDNAVKVYWSTGGQILPPHDQGIIDQVMATDQISRVDFSAAVRSGQIQQVTAVADQGYLAALAPQGFPGSRDIKILYSPLHGVGATALIPALEQDGFSEVELYGPHAEPNGDFPNVPGHVANPENPVIFDELISAARDSQQDLVLVTDPDCDRLGAAAPLTLDVAGPWRPLNGNQLGALLADFVLSQRKATGRLHSSHYVVKTLVTSELVRCIADSYGVTTIGDLHVGFKWIGGAMDEYGPDHFVFGAEESHGYLVGQYARDKDGAVAGMLLAEAAAAWKTEGRSLHQHLEQLYRRHGYFAERLVNKQMPGAAGMAEMQACMTRIRERPPRTFADETVVRMRDYLSLRTLTPGGELGSLSGPRGDLVRLDFADPNNGLALRPSGTEPKIKFYLFAYVPPESMPDLEATKAQVEHRLSAWQQAIASLGG